MRIEAARLESRGDVTTARGDVKAHFGGYQLCAAQVEYDRSTGLVQAVGEVRLLRGSGEVSGERARYNLQQQRGEMTPFHARPTGSSLRIEGEKIQWQGNAASASATRITSCPQDSSDWQLRAREVRQNELAQELAFHHATLEVVGIPVFYLPYGSIYYGKEKRSGFLWADLHFGSGGSGIVAPYYVALADNYDLTVTPNYYSRHGLEIGGEFRFLTADSDGNVQVATALGDSAGGRGREQLQYRVRHNRWQLQLEAENVSDDGYLRDYVGGDEKSTRTLPRRAALRYERGNLRLRAAVEHFKSLDHSLTAPHRAVPQLDAALSGSSAYADWHTALQYARFAHSSAPDGERLVWRGAARTYARWGGLSLSPALSAHATGYRNDASGAQGRFFVPRARLDAERLQHHLFSAAQQHDQLRLRAAMVYAPARARQNQAPLYDTEVREQNADNLFEGERFVGSDRAADAKFVAYGASYRLFDGGGERFYAGAGQRYHLSQPKIALPAETPPLQGFGNVLFDSRLRLGGDWTAAAAAEWAAREKTVSRFHAEVRGRFSPGRLLRVRYLQDGSESLVVGASHTLGNWLEAAFQTDYLLDKDHFTRSELALRLRDSCACWKISLLVRDLVVQKGDNQTEFSIGFELTGLGTVGNRYDRTLDKLR